MVTINWFIAGACEELSSHIGYAIAPAYKPLIKTILSRCINMFFSAAPQLRNIGDAMNSCLKSKDY